MISILQPCRPEICKYYCDKHTDRECFTELTMESWYGSKYDLNKLTVHLCDECVQNLYNLFKTEYSQLPEQVLL